MKHLAGRVAWVTGSSRGIGRVIASQLARSGASIVVHGTTPTSSRAFGEAESLAAVAVSIQQETSAKVLAVHGDLSCQSTVGRCVQQIHEHFSRIDILVNCAGGDIGAGGTQGPLGGKPENNDPLNISYEDIQVVLNRNLMTCILVCREIAPEMIERRSGKIVNIGSVVGIQGMAESAIYATAKAAVHHYSRCLAEFLRPYSVNVNVVAPGDIATARFLSSRAIDDSMLDDSGGLVRYGKPAEVASIVDFLASEAASYVTGQILRIDGGKQSWPA